MRLVQKRSVLTLRWRGAGVVERGGLEKRCARKGTEGSNPSHSATVKDYTAVFTAVMKSLHR